MWSIVKRKIELTFPCLQLGLLSSLTEQCARIKELETLAATTMATSILGEHPCSLHAAVNCQPLCASPNSFLAISDFSVARIR